MKSIINRRALATSAAVLLFAAPLAPPILPVPTAAAAECNGDECQSPPPAPEDPAPGTMVVEGPEDPPVHFPKEASPKHKHHRHRHRHRSSGR